MSRIRLWPLITLLAVATYACGDKGDVGAPCAVEEDCMDDLICDVHDGQGSCQEAHGHDEETEGEDG